MAAAKESMTRAKMADLYQDLRGKMSDKGATPPADDSVGKAIAREISKALAADPRDPPLPKGSRPRIVTEDLDFSGSEALTSRSVTPKSGSAKGIDKGQAAALVLVVTLAMIKIGLSFIENTGVLGATPVQATMINAPTGTMAPMGPRQNDGTYTRQEFLILTSLEEQRAALEDRAQKLEVRARELDTRDREFVVQAAELKALTEKLGADRTKTQKKKGAQIEQLANVYGAMNPEEAAKLLSELDVTIALALVEKMPEKRIGQIMAVMNPERALMLTRLLSGKERED